MVYGSPSGVPLGSTGVGSGVSVGAGVSVAGGVVGTGVLGVSGVGSGVGVVDGVGFSAYFSAGESSLRRVYGSV